MSNISIRYISANDVDVIDLQVYYLIYVTNMSDWTQHQYKSVHVPGKKPINTIVQLLINNPGSFIKFTVLFTRTEEANYLAKMGSQGYKVLQRVLYDSGQTT